MHQHIPPNFMLMGEAIARVADALRGINWEKDDTGISERLPFRVHITKDDGPELYWYISDTHKTEGKRKIYSYGFGGEDIGVAFALSYEATNISLDIINALYSRKFTYNIRFGNGLTGLVPYNYSGVWHARARFLMETGYIECPWNGKRGLLLIHEGSFINWLRDHKKIVDSNSKQASRVSSNDIPEVNAFCAYVAESVEKEKSRFTNYQWINLIEKLLKKRGLRATQQDNIGNGIIRRCILLHDIHVNIEKSERFRGAQSSDQIISSSAIIERVSGEISESGSFEGSKWFYFLRKPPRNNINFGEPSGDDGL